MQLYNADCARRMAQLVETDEKYVLQRIWKEIDREVWNGNYKVIVSVPEKFVDYAASFLRQSGYVVKESHSIWYGTLIIDWSSGSDNNAEHL